ncbi:MAG TPA: carboxypeptidase-like regulatory domain-containing protein, partial [Pedobacter sp.]|nr:carboxypeptidase-like regulatory domain-containing protein [Pedobacter sp.]
MKRAPHLILAAAVLATLLLGAFTTQREEPIDRLMAALQKWAGVHLQEKVYLHMDKPYYALGDTIWFKGYVTIGSRHQLSKLSGALYVELIDERDSLLSSLKLPLTAGMAMGDFTLGDAYRAGNYRIRAYTRWMRNAGVDYFFDKSFVVGDFLELTAGLEKPTELPESRQEQYELAEGRPVDIQFFPEGGNMVNGLYGRMAFKAVGTDGRGVDVSGKIIDNNGLEVTSFQSTHAGMGVFNILPEAGKIYQAKISLKDGTQKNISLPKPIDEGYTLAVYQPGGDSLLVRINATETMYKDARSVNLLVQSGGETIFGSKVKVSQKINSVWLRKSEFPSGIAQFTLFNEQAVPLNERIVFIKSNDRMELDILAPKQIYNSRERVDMELESRDRNGRLVPGNFSVAVIDESKLPSDEDDETSIFSSLLLSSDLKGYIERPNFYFTKDTVQTNKALDNLMLTQGYRRFVWKEILDAAPPKPLYRAESLGTELSGRVLTLSGKPVANGSVTLVSLTPGFLEVTKTDTAGRFRYEPIMLADSLRFALQARGDKNTKKVEVILDSVARQALGKNKNRPDFVRNIPEQTSVYLESSRKQDGLLEKKGMTSRVNRLKEVRIRARKIATEDMSSQGGVQIPDGHADFIYKMGDGDHCVSIAQCLQGRLGAVIFKPYPANNPEVLSFPHFKNAPMEVFLDGRRLRAMFEFTEIFDGAKLSPEDILKIDLVTSNQALMSIYSEGNARTPAIFIYTRKTRKPKYNPAMLNIKPKGFNSARVFYAPRYDRPVLSHQLPDLRSTIYWNAKMKTFASGRGRFSFFNADGPGTYKVVVEGINAAGELGRKVYRYEVKGGGKAMTNDLTAIDGQSAELVKAIQALQQIKPAEKLYVHTDRSFYNIGDTLWFKAYLFDASSLVASKRSGILYVELNDDSAENVRRISIPLKNGVGHAQIPLTRKIFHEGGYTFRAYTNWM